MKIVAQNRPVVNQVDCDLVKSVKGIKLRLADRKK